MEMCKYKIYLYYIKVERICNSQTFISNTDFVSCISFGTQKYIENENGDKYTYLYIFLQLEESPLSYYVIMK